MDYSISIADDDAAVREHIAFLVKSWADTRGLPVHVAAYESAEALLMENAQNADILLLDVEMGKINGMELAKLLRSRGSTAQFLFISGYPDYMPEGYDVEAVNYLLKPVDRTKLFEALDRAIKRLGRRDAMIVFQTDGGDIRLPEDEIISIEAFGHSCELGTEKESVRISESISQLEQRLGGSFVRCHRSYLVNLKWIAQLTHTEVVLDTGRRLPLSRRLADEVRRRFIAYYRGENDEPV